MKANVNTIEVHEDITTNKAINNKLSTVTNDVKKKVDNGTLSGKSKFGINFKVIANTIFLF